MKLYMVNLGGKVKGCNIEVHDVQFVAANHIDETIEVLKNHWYGLQYKLHFDSYKQIIGADGYGIELTEEKTDQGRQLYFVHLGGYRETSTQEFHDYFLFVGETEAEVKERAVNYMTLSDIQNHVDSIVCVDNCLLSADGKRYYIKLTESSENFDLKPDWFGYRRLDLE